MSRGIPSLSTNSEKDFAKSPHCKKEHTACKHAEYTLLWDGGLILKRVSSENWGGSRKM